MLNVKVNGKRLGRQWSKKLSAALWPDNFQSHRYMVTNNSLSGACMSAPPRPESDEIIANAVREGIAARKKHKLRMKAISRQFQRGLTLALNSPYSKARNKRKVV